MGFLRYTFSAFLGALFGAAVILYAVRPGPIDGARASNASSDSLKASDERLAIDPPLAASFVQSVYQSANPGVVSIVSTVDASPSRFFSSPRPEQGAGSGFVVDDRGFIVTNDHVVDGATQLRVTFSDGSTVPAKVVGQDAGDDLAVVRVDVPASRLHPLSLGDSSLVQIGQPAIVIGNPFNLHNTVTSGIVSALGRGRPGLNGRSIPDMIQTDAPANPGNSGGPILDSQGYVIGVLAQIESPVRGSVGVGFAIPSNTVSHRLAKLEAGETVKQAWLGIAGQTVTADLAKSLDLGATEGIYVIDVSPKGPSDAAGVIPSAAAQGGAPGVGGDVITAIDGVAVKAMQDLGAHLADKSPGDSVALSIARAAGASTTVTVVLGAWPDQQPSSP